MNRVIRKRLGDIVNFKRGYDLPSYNRREGNYPIISSGGISGYHSEFKKDGEGLITGRYGTLGEMYYINGKYWPHNTALYATDFKGNYPKYVYFLMKCLGNLKTSDKSTVPGVNRNDLHEIVVTYIKPEFQKEIADILFLIDAKIELNNRINRELEAMAKTLFDYWFVQFDFPNEQGNPYKSSGGKMVYNAELKREIPEGWEVKKLSEIANITMGQSPEGSSYNDDGIGEIFFQGSTDFGWRYPTIRQYTTQPSRRAKAGDILLSVRAPVGTLNIADNDCCIGRGLAALNSKSGYDSYLYYVMEYFKQIFDNRNNAGTTFGSITKDDLFSLKLVYPKDDQLKKYNHLVAKYNQMILNNYKQNQQLSELRDWLLPMLMNGQVTVKEAEEKLSMAAEPGGEKCSGFQC